MANSIQSKKILKQSGKATFHLPPTMHHLQPITCGAGVIAGLLGYVELSTARNI